MNSKKTLLLALAYSTSLLGMELTAEPAVKELLNARLELCLHKPTMLLGYCGYYKKECIEWTNFYMYRSFGINRPVVAALLQKGDDPQGEYIYFPLPLLIELTAKKAIIFSWYDKKTGSAYRYRLENKLYLDGVQLECKSFVDNTYKAFLQMKGTRNDGYPLHIAHEDKSMRGVSEFCTITIGDKPSTLINSQDSFNFKAPTFWNHIKNFLDSNAGEAFSKYKEHIYWLERQLTENKIIAQIDKKFVHGPNGYPAFIDSMRDEKSYKQQLAARDQWNKPDSYLSLLPPEIIEQLFHYIPVIKEEYKSYAFLYYYHKQIESKLMLEKK